MATSDIDQITARVNWIIGSRGDSFNAVVADDRFDISEIYRAILETESELVQDICESKHQARTTYLTDSTTLANGDGIPTHIGQVESVKIQPYTAAAYQLGEATSRDNIIRWRENLNSIFDPIAHDQVNSGLAGYFDITNETITFTGVAAKARICVYNPDYSGFNLRIDDRFDSGLVSGTITKLNKLGVPQALVDRYGSIYSVVRTNIRQGLSTMPDIEDVQAND